jgi:hypothetical protein
LTRVTWTGAALGGLFLANWLLGGAASEKALRDLDQHLLDAYASKLGSADEAWRVNGFAVEQRIPLPVLSFYRGQSLVANREISCASRRSIVAWYGAGATVAWQNGVWFPNRAAVLQRFAVTGSLR